MKMEHAKCSERSAHKIQTLGKHPKERIQHSDCCEPQSISFHTNLFNMLQLRSFLTCHFELALDCIITVYRSPNGTFQSFIKRLNNIINKIYKPGVNLIIQIISLNLRKNRNYITYYTRTIL